MRIGINCLPLAPGKIGGMEQYFRNLLKHLLLLDPSDEYVLFVTRENEATFAGDPPRVKLVLVPDPFAVAQVVQAVEAEGLDLYFCPFLVLDPRSVTPPSVATIPDVQHEFYPEMFSEDILAWRRDSYAYTVRNAEAVLTLSEFSRRTIMEKYGAPADKVHAIHLDAGDEHQEPCPPERIAAVRGKYQLPDKFLFYPANTWPHKNHALLLRALKRVRDGRIPGLSLVLTGAEDKFHPNILALIRELGLSGAVRFLNYIDGADLPALYRSAEALAFPSLFEGFGIPLLEAMHAGLPVLAADDTSIPEVAGDAALLFDPNDPQDLADKVCLLLGDAALRKSLVEKGTRRLGLFSWKDCAKKTHAVFKRSVRRRLEESARFSVTVLLRSLDQPALLRKTIESVLAQDYPNVRLTVLDGGSGPEARELLDRYGARIRVVENRNDALCDALQSGVLHSGGDIVTWLHPGDSWNNDALSTVVKLFSGREDLDVIYGQALEAPHDLPLGKEAPFDTSEYSVLAEKGYRCVFPVFIRRKAFVRSPLLDERAVREFNYNKWLQIASGIRVAYAPSLRLNCCLLDCKAEGDAGRMARRLRAFYPYDPISWVPGGPQYRPKDKKMLRLLSRVGIFSGPGDYRPPSWPAAARRMLQYVSFRALIAALRVRRRVLTVWSRFMQRLRTPVNVYLGIDLNLNGSINIRKWLRPCIGTLGNESLCKPIELRPCRNGAGKRSRDYPKISMVTPSYNQAHFLETTLRSVLDQDYPNLEYVVMDGGSKDHSVDIIKKYAGRLSSWASQKDGGQTNALNLGFARTQGEIMAYLNSDDLLLPGSLHYVAHYFEKHPEVDAVYGHRILINAQGLEIGRWILPRHNDEIIRMADYVPQETLFWRRSVWDRTGGRFDESFHYAMDWDLIIRFLGANARMVRAPAFLGAFRVHDQQKTTAALSVGEKEVNLIRRRVLGYEPSRLEIHRVIRFYLLKARALEIAWKLGLAHYEL